MKTKLHRFLALLHARNLEFIRDRAALAWAFIFPILVIFGFAFAFNRESADLFKVGLISTPTEIAPELLPIEKNFLETKHLEWVKNLDRENALKKLQRHQLDLLVRFSNESTQYWVNETSPKGYLAEKILLASIPNASRETVIGQEIRYVDWLISGLLGMNMMFGALFGVGYVIVRYRKSGVLKRLKATPISPFEFLFAQVISRLILLVLTTSIIYVGSNFFIGFQVFGSYFDLFIVLTLGALCLISLGLVISVRTASEELAGGLLNLLSWPMMFLSGVWFSLEGANPVIQKVALAFPLTHIINASRAIMTEGATLASQGHHVLALISMTVLFLFVGVLLFRWE